MKKEFLSIFFALALVMSFGLVIAVPSAYAAGPPVYQSFTENHSGLNYGNANDITSIAVAKPSSLTCGDLLIGILVTDGSPGTITAPTNWTSINSGGAPTGTPEVFVSTWYRVAGASEPASYTWSWTTAQTAVAYIIRIVGADQANPIDASAAGVGSGNTATITITCPTVTTTVANTLVLRIFGMDSCYGATGANPGTLIARESSRIDCASGSQGHTSGGAAYSTQAGIGATGTANFTATGVGSGTWNWRGVTIAIKPCIADCGIAAPTAVCANSTGNTASVGDAGTCATYAWTITNGAITSATNIRQITWDASNTTPVTLGVQIIKGISCNCTGLLQVIVNPSPDCTSASSNSPVCEGSTLNLYGSHTSTTPPYFFSWSGPNGFTSNDQNPIRPNATTNMSGDYTLTVTDSGSPACSGTTTIHNVTVNPKPVCCLTAPIAVCADSTGNTASVPDAGTGATYAWSITNGTITAGQNTSSITWSAGSTSPVTIFITITNANLCQCTSSANVTVNPNPDCTITAPPFVLDSSSGNTASVPDALTSATYAWSITNGTITAGQNTSSITWRAGTTINQVTIGVMITDANGCHCTSSADVPVISTNTSTSSATAKSVSPVRSLAQPPITTQFINTWPHQAYAGQPVTITTNVVNNGTDAGNYTINLKINGQVEQTKTVGVGPQATQPVKFTVTKAQPGTYSINIDGQKDSFIILGTGGKTTGQLGSGALIAIVAVAILIIITFVLIMFRRRTY
jgi:PKD-like domain/CARDB